MTVLTSVLALVTWTLIMWLWMYATRLPAMSKAGVDPQDAQHPGSLDALPSEVRRIADNYNHLHEQPTIFYALALYCHLAGMTDGLTTQLCWAYVGVRVLHSLVQATINKVLIRFLLFAAGSIILMVIAVRAVLAVV